MERYVVVGSPNPERRPWLHDGRRWTRVESVTVRRENSLTPDPFLVGDVTLRQPTYPALHLSWVTRAGLEKAVTLSEHDLATRRKPASITYALAGLPLS